MAKDKLSKELIRELASIKKKEIRWMEKPSKSGEIKQKIYDKVPQGLRGTLEKAFAKAFELIFIKGKVIIEKTFDKNDLILEYKTGDYAISQDISKKSIKRLGKSSQKNGTINKAVTTISGFGLGFMGMGLPDIPLLVSTMLKGIYEISLSYGFDYEIFEEKVYILRLIRTALAFDSDRLRYNHELDLEQYDHVDLDEEIRITAAVVSDALLVEKFVQGIPFVGIIGGFVNHRVYKKIAELAAIKYRKRYFMGKLNIYSEI